MAKFKKGDKVVIKENVSGGHKEGTIGVIVDTDSDRAYILSGDDFFVHRFQHIEKVESKELSQ